MIDRYDFEYGLAVVTKDGPWVLWKDLVAAIRELPESNYEETAYENTVSRKKLLAILERQKDD